MATTYYVRPDGDDNNTGTGTGVDEAWATVGKAWTDADTAGDLVWIAPGFYEETLVAKNHGTSANPVQYIGDPTGTVFGVDAGNVQIYRIYTGGASNRVQYVLLKNIIIASINLISTTGSPNYAGGWIKAINCCFYASNGFYRQQGNGITTFTAYFYAYNCSFAGAAIAVAGFDSNEYLIAYFYNCAAATSISFTAGTGSSLTRDYCIAPTGGGTNFIAADPDFSDPTFYDFALNPGSQAIDSGYDFDENDDPDVYGFTRIYNGTIDRGAAESAQLGVPTWVYPAADGATFFISNPWVILTAPTPTVGTPNLHFKVASYAVNAPLDVLMAWESVFNPEKFKVWNGSTWIDFPAEGIGAAYYGQSVACYLNLSRRDVYWFKAWAGAVT